MYIATPPALSVIHLIVSLLGHTVNGLSKVAGLFTRLKLVGQQPRPPFTDREFLMFDPTHSSFVHSEWSVIGGVTNSNDVRRGITAGGNMSGDDLGREGIDWTTRDHPIALKHENCL